MIDDPPVNQPPIASSIPAPVIANIVSAKFLAAAAMSGFTLLNPDKNGVSPTIKSERVFPTEDKPEFIPSSIPPPMLPINRPIPCPILQRISIPLSRIPSRPAQYLNIAPTPVINAPMAVTASNKVPRPINAGPATAPTPANINNAPDIANNNTDNAIATSNDGFILSSFIIANIPTRASNIRVIPAIASIAVGVISIAFEHISNAADIANSTMDNDPAAANAFSQGSFAIKYNAPAIMPIATVITINEPRDPAAYFDA